MNVVLFGATGLVGSRVLALALADPAVNVIAPSRRALPAHPHLTNPVHTDLASFLPELPKWAAEVVVWAAGTTMRSAGSKQAFYAVDHDLPIALGRAAREAGASTMVFLSAQGASRTSRFFYLRMKAETEAALRTIEFASLTVVRPGFISGRQNDGFVEKALEYLRPALPRSLQTLPAADVAGAVWSAAREGRHGFDVVDSTVMDHRKRQR